MTTKLQKWGNSQGIRIPKQILESLQWNDDDKVVLIIKDGNLVIKKEDKPKNIEELFADFEGEYTPVEMDWGEPVGKEIW